jgi:aminopeptidase-like protein/aminoglycoside N3'-acetyltransferase
MTAPFDYTQEQLAAGLRAAGVVMGDVVFVHVSLGRLGYPDRGRTMEAACAVLHDALREAVGPAGTILVPTYTYSIGKREVFDVENTPSGVGEFTELFRQTPEAVRSADPMLSVAGLGPAAAMLLKDLPRTCYGPGSIYDRLYEAGGKICVIGLPLHWATYRHYVEERARVPFRFPKLFTGLIREGGNERRETWIYSAAPLTANCQPDGVELERRARAAGLCRGSHVGRGEVCVIGAREYCDFALAELKREPWLSAKGPALTVAELVAKEDARTSAQKPAVNLPPAARMRDMLNALAPLRRDIISDGYDASLDALARQVPMTIHECPTGTEAFTWIVPEKWVCKEAWLETLEGERLFSYADHPLHVVSYSLPFEGEVSREELFQHLHTHPRLPEAIPFGFKYYERDWGLCCSQRLKDSLTAERYKVRIKTEASFGTLKVGEAIAPGRSEDCIVLCAHLCHPGQANDDLTGLVVGMEVMRRLQARTALRYTYRLLLLPETIGSVAYLSANQSLIPKMKGGLFLEMLGRSHPFILQRSFAADSEVDQCFALGLQSLAPEAAIQPFRSQPGNDERQFNSPGVRVPMLALYRIVPRDHPDWPYREYHSSEDTPALVKDSDLEESCDAVLRMIDTLEQNAVPKNEFQGEVFLSRYGLNIDWYAHPQAHQQLFNVLYEIDGRLSIAEIALKLGTSFAVVKSVLDRLHAHRLVSFSA